MATPAELAAIREYVNEPTPELYSDERLTELYAASGQDLNKTASLIWSTKAARYASLVDVQEGSSSRRLGDLYEQAIAMSTHWGSLTDESPVSAMRPGRTRPIVRP